MASLLNSIDSLQAFTVEGSIIVSKSHCADWIFFNSKNSYIFGDKNGMQLYVNVTSTLNMFFKEKKLTSATGFHSIQYVNNPFCTILNNEWISIFHFEFKGRF